MKLHVHPSSRLLPALLLLSLLTACADDPAAVSPEELPAGLASSTTPDREWTPVERAAFAFRLPPGFLEAGEQISRNMGRYLRGRDGSTLFFRYGSSTAGARPPEGATDLRQAWATIGGRRVHLAVWTLEGSRVVRGWWPRVGQRGGETLNLLLGGTFTAATGREDLLGAIRSVRLR